MSITDIAGGNLLGDKAYGMKEILTYIVEHRATVVIPPKSNAKVPWAVDDCLYKERHLVECFFQKVKWFRRVATRYDNFTMDLLSNSRAKQAIIFLLFQKLQRSYGYIPS